MDTLLIIITIISAATAIIALVSARRVRKAERERSEARVAALSAAADAPRKLDGGWTQVAGEWQWVPEPSDAVVTRKQIPDPQSPIPAASESFASGSMFGTVQRDEPATNRTPLMAAAALLVLIGGALVLVNTTSTNDSAGTVASVAHEEPIELVALGHARDVSVLTISGAVRNPSTGAKLEGLTAVVSLLDRDGSLVSTKDVPLDYRALRPGEEAPFKISIPNPGSIARYRVSFRAGTEVVPHVDRRSDSKLASANN